MTLRADITTVTDSVRAETPEDGITLPVYDHAKAHPFASSKHFQNDQTNQLLADEMSDTQRDW